MRRRPRSLSAVDHTSPSPRRLWVVTELYWPEESSTGHIMTGLAEGLARYVPVRVLCGQPTYLRRGLMAPRRETRSAVSVNRVWSTRLDKDSIAGRALNYLSVTASLFARAAVGPRRGDAILVVTNPPTLPYAMAVVARLRGIPYALVIHDIFPDATIALGWLNAESALARAGRAAARWLYRGASAIAVLGEDMATNVRETASLSPGVHNIGVVTSWADLEYIEPHDRADSEILERLGLTDRFVVQFAGNIGPLQDLPNLLSAMDILKRRHDIHLLVVGDGRLRSWVEAEVRERHMTNVTVIDPVPRSRVCEIHRACDVAVVSLIDGMLGVSVPSRAYNFMAAGRPIVAAVHPDSEIGLTVASEDIGWVVGSGDAAALATALESAADDPERVETMGRRARRVAEETYSRTAVVSSMVELLQLGASENDSWAVASSRQGGHKLREVPRAPST